MSDSSKALLLVAQSGWNYRPGGDDHLVLESCPFCYATYKFYINVCGEERDGMWDCKKCAESGNLYQLRNRLGLNVENNVLSVQGASNAAQQPQPLPDINALHWRLLNDTTLTDVLDYLVHDRGISIAVIEKYKLGADIIDGKPWLVYPYLNTAGQPIFVKYRSVPPNPKAFFSSPGRAVPLFNGGALKEGMDELIIVEGEIDTLSLLSHGYESVVGVPGANVKKTDWVDLIDKVAPKNIYLLYDNDQVGQDAAKAMASKIGIEKCKNILLPKFQIKDKDGKDVNEWLKSGYTLSNLEELISTTSKRFDVAGVQSLVEVIEEFRRDLEERGVDPKYTTMWPSLNKHLGGFEDGDLVGWSAEGKVGKTTAMLNLLDWYASVHGHPSLLHCLEMSPKRLIRKWISCVTQTDDTPGSSQITKETIDQALEIGRQMKADLMFGYQKVKRSDEVFELIYQAVRRYGVKVVCFDNLQLLVRSLEHSTQETSRLTKDFKAIAMELKILFHLIVQPNRVAEGQIIAARNASGSSAIEKDVDAYICFHRNRVMQIKSKDFTGFLDVQDNFEPQMLTRVDLTRYAPGGTCTLYMDGARSTVREMDGQDIVKAQYQPALIGTEQVSV